jgi:decaprenylphosphoryl-5-phosphoribose phosphatase
MEYHSDRDVTGRHGAERRSASSLPSLGARLRALDMRVLRVLRTRAHSPAVEAGVIVLARTGENGLLWHGVAVAGLALHGERRGVYARSIGVVLVTLAANSAVKLIVRRARPALEDLPALTPFISGRSYPSAHALTSFAGARALSSALPGGPLYGLAVAMALSRPYLGVHYPSDILAGALLGDALGRLLTP